MSTFSNTLKVYKGWLYMARRSNVAGTSLPFLAGRWDGSTVEALGTGSLTGLVECIEPVTHNQVYVGGTFTQLDGSLINRLALWNGSSYSQVGNGVADSGLSAIYYDSDNDRLYIGGSFNNIDSGDGKYACAYYNSGSWTHIDVGSTGSTDRIIQTNQPSLNYFRNNHLWL